MALSNLLYQIDVNTLILVSFFIIVFAMLMWILRKTALGKNNAIATVISLAIAFMAMYGLNTLNIDLTFQFYQLGLTDEILYIATPSLVLLFVYFLSRKKDPATGKKKFSFPRFLLILGAITFGLGFMPFIYQKAFMIGLGAILMAIGEFLNLKKNKKSKFPNNPNPTQGSNNPQLRQQGIAALTNAAKQFKKWVLTSKKTRNNPKFYGSWANFINYLTGGPNKRGPWGNSEAEIIQTLNITRKDFVRIFNRYGKV